MKKKGDEGENRFKNGVFALERQSKTVVRHQNKQNNPAGRWSIRHPLEPNLFQILSSGHVKSFCFILERQNRRPWFIREKAKKKEAASEQKKNDEKRFRRKGARINRQLNQFS